MLQIQRTRDEVIVKGTDYCLSFSSREPEVARLSSCGTEIVKLFILSSCDTELDYDCSTVAGQPEVHHGNGFVDILINAQSDIWDRKCYVFHCSENAVEYHYLISGKGAVTQCHFFHGLTPNGKQLLSKRRPEHFPDNSYKPEINSYYRGSEHNIQCLFNPQPNGIDKQYFRFFESNLITMLGEHSYLGSNFYFAPSPFCYSIKSSAAGWITLGVGARQLENNYSTFNFLGGDSIGFTLDFDGYTKIAGDWESPTVVLIFNNRDEYEAQEKYVSWLSEKGWVNLINRDQPDWWKRPLFCGWGEQSYLGMLTGKAPEEYATQNYYESFVNTLQAKGLDYGTLIIDWGWTDSPSCPVPNPVKWPDLKGFIQARHAQGIKVLLHLRTWVPDGLPAEECITTPDGKAVTCDPLNPAFKERLRSKIKDLLSPDGFDADGIKTDGNWRGPKGWGLHHYGNLWGLELQKELFTTMYTAVKESKPDALFSSCSVHPYLAEVSDMIRLNDIFTDQEHIIEKMQFRAKIAKITNPFWLIDCDNWPCYTRSSWLEYMEYQPHIGVPSLYYATHIDMSGEAITEADYQFLKDLWRKYQKGRVQI